MMLVCSLLLVLCNVQLATVALDSLDVKESNLYFANIEDVSTASSIVENVPISFFYDVVKAEYRTGILASQLKAILPELTMTVVQKADGEKSGTSSEVLAFDSTTIFMHALLEIKELINLDAEMLKNITNAGANFEGIAEAANRLHNSTVDLGAKYSQLRKRSTSAMLNLIRANRAIERVKYRDERAKKRSSERLKEKMTLKLELHDRLELAIQEHSDNLTAIGFQKSNSSHLIAEQNKLSELNVEIFGLQFEAEMEKQKLDEQLRSVAQRARIRAEEEAKAELASEQYHLNIMHAKDLANREQVNVIIAVIRDGLVQQAAYFANDPWGLLRQSRFLLLGLCFFVLIYEFAQAIHWSLTNRVSSSKSLRFRRPDQNSATTLAHMESLSDQTQRKLHSLSRSIEAGINNRSPLPIALFYGVSGVGKTLSAVTVAQRVNLPYAILTGADLEGLGPKAPSFLRKLLNNSHQTTSVFGQTRLLIIDDPHDVIARRGGSSGSIENGFSSNSCFFVLLQALRASHCNLAIIITTSHFPEDIDEALLDRVDLVVEFSTPTMQQRIKFLSAKMPEMLFPFLDATTDSAAVLAVLQLCHESLANLSDTTHILAISNLLDSKRCSQRDGFWKRIDKQKGGSACAEIFEIESGMINLLMHSEDWSLRELEKFLLNVQSSVLGSERCILTTELWLKEISFLHQKQISLAD